MANVTIPGLEFKLPKVDKTRPEGSPANPMVIPEVPIRDEDYWQMNARNYVGSDKDGPGVVDDPVGNAIIGAAPGAAVDLAKGGLSLAELAADYTGKKLEQRAAQAAGRRVSAVLSSPEHVAAKAANYTKFLEEGGTPAPRDLPSISELAKKASLDGVGEFKTAAPNAGTGAVQAPPRSIPHIPGVTELHPSTPAYQRLIEWLKNGMQ